MKIRQIQDENQQHIVALEKEGVMRCYFKNTSLHTACSVFDTLRRDVERHGESVVDFAGLPLVLSRVAKSGKIVYRVSSDA